MMAEDRFAEARRQAQLSVDIGCSRNLTCGRCGTTFACSPFEKCWCSDEDFRLPVPLPEPYRSFGDCLCANCLRTIATELRRLRR
jgi:hypothetical protein